MIFLFAYSCRKDKIPVRKEEPVSKSYCDSMKTAGRNSFKCEINTIVKTYCALSGCHVAGTGLPDLSTYSGVFAQKDRIRQRAVVQKDMPPYYVTLFPADSLREKLGNWIDKGANDN